MSTITMKQFLVNPTGKGSASVARRDFIRRDLESRYNRLFKNGKLAFSVNPYLETRTKDIYIHFKVPSEDYYEQGLFYDVLIRFYLEKGKSETTPIELYNIQVFSNSPNFLFTYAYIFNKDDLIIPWLKPKLPPRALTDEPLTRNPDMAYGFEKSVYYSLLYLKEHYELLTWNNLTKRTFNREAVRRDVKTSYQKLEENKVAKKAFTQAEREKKELQKSQAVPRKYSTKEKEEPRRNVPMLSKPKEKIGKPKPARRAVKHTTKGKTKK